MKIVEIIESKKWKNKLTGQCASTHGAVPWAKNSEKELWEIVVVGYTWKLDNGTVGLGRIPAKTMTEAVEVMEAFNKLRE